MSFTIAKDLLLCAVKENARVVLFGNRFEAEHGKPTTVDIREAKDFAAANSSYSFEGTSLDDTMSMLRFYTQTVDQTEQVEEEKKEEVKKKNWLGQLDKLLPLRGKKLLTPGVLKPSLRGTPNMKRRKDATDSSELRPVQELHDSDSPITCICFGQERLHRNYILLAAASKNGIVVVYRCYRTEMERAMMMENDFMGVFDEDSDECEAPDNSNIAVHSRLEGHTRAITSILFSLLEDQLVTTSIDKSVRFWSVPTGEMLKVFTDSSPVPVACFLPFNPAVFVAANSNAVLRLVNVQNGLVMQKLKVENEVRALVFEETGMHLFAGTKNGSMHVLEANDSGTIKFKFKTHLARGGITCITFVKKQEGNPNPPMLLVNTSDSSVAIVECVYHSANNLTNLTVRHRVKVAHSLLPLKNCYCPSGFLISGSEDKDVYIYSLAKGAGYKQQTLKHHTMPVVAVATNVQQTLLVSADSNGRIVLWRSMDLSHLREGGE